MITAKEINTFSRQLGVPAVTIDKDWVLGHLLYGIYQNDYLGDNLVFKGGTCLKKCYFADYRFSEDLDFTALHATKSKLLANLGMSSLKPGYCLEKSGAGKRFSAAFLQPVNFQCRSGGPAIRKTNNRRRKKGGHPQ